MLVRICGRVDDAISGVVNVGEQPHGGMERTAKL